MRPTVLAYYFPNWHRDPRNADWFGANWTEWELVKAATARFPGHRQPRVPALGCRDEADPAVAAADIDLAATHGVDGFLFDYYWYDDGPYLSGALDDGFLQAPNTDRLRFALMWANHQLVDIFPSRSGGVPDLLKSGALDRSAFEAMVRHVIDRYFSRSNYLVIDGRPWFTLYDIGNFIEGLGGVEAARQALDWFREQTVLAGFPGLHLDGVLWSAPVLPASGAPSAVADVVDRLGFDSGTSYVWLHHFDASTAGFPNGSIQDLRDSAFREYDRYAEQLGVDFYPNVTVGWDPSPRTGQELPYQQLGYPWTSVWDQDPAEFATGLRRALEYLERHRPRHSIITVNAWNEWTEGSYLLPDTTHGSAYLQAVRDVLHS
ncbi:glycosyl transferase family WbsX [Kribbella voronezhensis]|uniref:Glycosyl transferase family WbsX n=1 Tax=Kribbella voronezhensis TaxID=2512212 RepID=A0A4R7T403_9ACTN|nr:glycoside hydrolase family 99-like domain-containing protein [Kribbella voronezhensis]TDU86522.1 glycosyl transferase family WbsX [Kribbella voronezhensis]